MQRCFVYDEGRRVKYGFTTGSCSAAAAKAAAYMLLGGNRKKTISIDTPAGIRYEAELEDIYIGEDYVSCAVRKNSGDDPDITNNILVYATVNLMPDKEDRIIIEGGAGVGKVTRPGLDQRVGNAAINSVPRQMIEKEVREVKDMFDCPYSLKVIISVPGGEKIAEKTFNPRLGIEGGISIIGTTGIVEPMSTKAILDTIYIELRQKKEQGATIAVVSPGNYGLDFMKQHYGYDLDRAVKCSNYIGETIDMAAELGYKNMLIAGHIGKLIKLSGGIMNTHSGEADCRMELMATAAFRSNASVETITAILDSLSTEEAYEYMVSEHIEKSCFEYIMSKIAYYLGKRAKGRLDVSCMVYSNKRGLLGVTDRAEEMLERAKND